MSTAGKARRQSDGKIPRDTDGKTKRAATTGDGCCCCPCGECDSLSTCIYCGACTPTQFTLTTSGITSLTGCYPCAGGCARNTGACLTGGGAVFDSIQVSGAFVNGTYTLTQDGGDPCIWNYTSASPIEMRFYPEGVSDCSGSPCAVTGNLRLELIRTLTGYLLAIWIEEDDQLCTLSHGAGIFKAFIVEPCCTADMTLSNVWTTAGASCTLDNDSVTDTDFRYLAAYGGTAMLTPC